MALPFEDDVWVTRDGRHLTYGQLTDDHLVNVIQMTRRTYERKKRQLVGMLKGLLPPLDLTTGLSPEDLEQLVDQEYQRRLVELGALSRVYARLLAHQAARDDLHVAADLVRVRPV